MESFSGRFLISSNHLVESLTRTAVDGADRGPALEVGRDNGSSLRGEIKYQIR